MREFSTIYEDEKGIVKTSFIEELNNLKITIRGIEFSGWVFEELLGKIDHDNFSYFEFSNLKDQGLLTNCKFNIDIPLGLVIDQKFVWSNLSVEIFLHYKKQNGLLMKLKIDDRYYKSNLFPNHDFEDALIEIQKQLPKEIKIKSCISCKYSHQFMGHRSFSELFCYVNGKEAFNKIIDRDTLIENYTLLDKQKKVFHVNDIYICEHHEFMEKERFTLKLWGENFA